MCDSNKCTKSRWPIWQEQKNEKEYKKTNNTPQRLKRDENPVLCHLVAKETRNLLRNALDSRYHLFVDFEENPKTCMRVLEVLYLVRLILVLLMLFYGFLVILDLADTCICIFSMFSENKTYFG